MGPEPSGQKTSDTISPGLNPSKSITDKFTFDKSVTSLRGLIGLFSRTGSSPSSQLHSENKKIAKIKFGSHGFRIKYCTWVSLYG